MEETKCLGLDDGFCCVRFHVNYSAHSVEEVKDGRMGSKYVAAKMVVI